jgi:hypothetical protein
MSKCYWGDMELVLRRKRQHAATRWGRDSQAKIVQSTGAVVLDLPRIRSTEVLRAWRLTAKNEGALFFCQICQGIESVRLEEIVMNRR